MTSNQATETTSISTYLDELASSSHTPGGGAATALSGAQAAALLQMVCNLTRGEKFDSIKEEIDSISDSLGQIRTAFIRLKSEDEAAFSNLMAAYKLSKHTEEEIVIRKTRIAESLGLAAKAPLDMLNEVRALIPLASRLAKIGNRNLLTDIGVSAHLTESTLAGARLNIFVNIRLMDTNTFTEECQKSITETEKLLAEGFPPIYASIGRYLKKNTKKPT